MESASEATVCRFCAVASGTSHAQHDKPLLETDNFVVIPSLGGFIEGWLLVVSRKHLLNLRETPDSYRDELDAVADDAAALVQSRYGPCVRFEHGPGRCGSPAGCSIDHAHLHIVPHAQTLRDALEATSLADLSFKTIQTFFDDVSAQPGDSYIYLKDADGQSYLGFSPDIESQLVRRLLAKREGRGSHFDWREDLALEEVRRTRAALAAA